MLIKMLIGKNDWSLVKWLQQWYFDQLQGQFGQNNKTILLYPKTTDQWVWGKADFQHDIF